MRRGEAAAAGVPEGREVPGFSPAEAAPVAEEFGQKWQHMVESINRYAGGRTGEATVQRQSTMTGAVRPCMWCLALGCSSAALEDTCLVPA